MQREHHCSEAYRLPRTLPRDGQEVATVAANLTQLISERSVFTTDAGALHRATFSALAKAVSKNAPVQMVLPAFPAKSNNPEKTYGVLPDAGEFVALTYLQGLCAQIEAAYAPGAQLVLCSDGHVFSEEVGVTDADVDQYLEALKKIIVDHRFNYLSTYSLQDYYQRRGDAANRELLLSEFAETKETMREQVASDPDRRNTFNGIHRFLFEDFCHSDAQASRNQLRNKAKRATYEVLRRSDAWSRLVAKAFPNAVRLSIHPHSFQSDKLGIKLVNGGGDWATPWHNVLVAVEDHFLLMKRREAENLGATVRLMKGRYAYYTI